MDSKLATFYRLAYENIADQETLKIAQRSWLKERDRCLERTDKEEACRCLKKRYDRRIDELRVLDAGHKLWDPPPAMTPEAIEQVYVSERRETLKLFFENRPLKTTLGKDDPLCADFSRDFTAQNKAVELVPPKVVVHDYDDPQLQREIFDYCPDLELRSYKIGMSGPYVGPRNFLLFEVDIDNDPENGDDFVYLKEVMEIRETPWMYPEEEKPAPRIVADNTFISISLRNCKYRGFTGTGFSRGYPIDHDVSHDDPQVGLYGVIRYQGKHYLYDVIETETKAQLLTLIEYNPDGFDNFKMRCGYKNRRN